MSTLTAALGLPPGVVPPRFAEALLTFQGALSRCEAAGIPAHSALAAGLVELLPRLIAVYGAEGVADVLATLAAHVGGDVMGDDLVAGRTRQ
ncbi:hypothetical protein [Nitrospirillum viridazoti]|uniref:Uncharacterized protein n=1 Tax=Nitrospirillum amazonense TaxID=28077 RepID=A0A560I426_9PROT|nr:hypothetical protein [Nitrospirillum amazonense]TWB52709.1 hypothetical protein FBZ92_11875 [Nitrospirillum amazonense]